MKKFRVYDLADAFEDVLFDNSVMIGDWPEDFANATDEELLEWFMKLGPEDPTCMCCSEFNAEIIAWITACQGLGPSALFYPTYVIGAYNFLFDRY